MYQYDTIDRDFLASRSTQFRDQVARRLSGALSEDEFKPLRLQNGLYLQLHAYMLRVAIPYGVLSSRQLRGLAGIARDFDRGFGHFTTRQNIQFNWIKLIETPDILDRLAGFDMHAIQTSGNCIRNVTSDPLAGAMDDEVENPLVWCEVIRQWSTLHPEFAFLPRKFKIAVSAGAEDRAATGFHDIGLRLVKARSGEVGFRVLVGGGQGRTPRVAQQLTPFLSKKNLLSYLEAILRVYNAAGRRDNIYKARLKILVEAMGIEAFGDAVNGEWVAIRDSVIELPSAEFERIQRHFARKPLPPADPASDLLDAHRRKRAAFDRWMRHNILPHYDHGYANVSISIKALGRPPGDASASEMERIADLADRYGGGEIRVTYSQDVVIPHVRRDQLIRVFEGLEDIGLHGGENGLISDMIVCPGLDYCNLANARSLPLADRIFRHFADAGLRDEIGRIRLNISGCINACGHHHAADIGILGVNKKGVENYQISLGGRAGEDAAVGRILGPSFEEDRVPEAIAAIVGVYLDRRQPDESFGDAVARLGVDMFKRELYAPV
ncbi:MAG: nitrite/sulfite reductase [Alphaproteobacteria bacterium]